MRRDKANYVIQSVSHALDVLEQFRGDTEELGVTELSKRLKLHKNNVFRLLATLESRGYIEQNRATDNYRLGIRCLQLGRAYLERVALLKQAEGVVREVAQQSGETAFIAVLRNSGVVALLSVESSRPVRAGCPVGEYLPLHCSAAGKVHLAAISDGELRDRLLGELPALTARTITDREKLAEELRRVAQRGIATEIGERVEDVNGLAVPIRDYTGHVVASLGVTGPAYRLTESRIHEQAADLLATAGRQLSNRLGFDA